MTLRRSLSPGEINNDLARTNARVVIQINAHWQAKGVAANARVVQRECKLPARWIGSRFVPAVQMTIPAVVSDLVNGRPKDAPAAAQTARR